MEMILAFTLIFGMMGSIGTTFGFTIMLAGGYAKEATYSAIATAVLATIALVSAYLLPIIA